MGNNQLLPFERNRYYVGKLLTSADFQAEQTYVNHKRRFLNGILFGGGIVCGLGVYSLDDLSIMVDSGVALDDYGREIAVESPVVRKLSTVEGFESLETDRALLCLGYQEENVHPVYTVRGQESGEIYECNRIREGWQLFLKDSASHEEAFVPELEFFTSALLYADDDYMITCTMPAQVPCGKLVRMDVTVERLQDTAGPLTVKAVLQTPAFTNENGNHELYVELQELDIREKLTLPFYLQAQSTPLDESVILADNQLIQVEVAGEERSVRENFVLRTSVVAMTPAQIVDQAAASTTLEMHSLNMGQDHVVLAELVLQRTRNAYLIEEVRLSPVRRYIRTAAADSLREELSEWFKPSAPAVDKKETAAPFQQKTPEAPGNLSYATGICEIPLETNMRRGQVAYSDEIVHGLGSGTVYVTIGAEYLADDMKLGITARNTIYGNVSLFQAEQTPVVPVETAVRVMNDRGSFVVAARLLEETTQVVLTLRWVAMMLPGGEETRVNKLNGKSIAAIQPTVVMATRESRFFNVRFNNMEPCTLTYELTEKDSGEITSDGVYTAPGREGVFEIRIFCTDAPLITTYAYAVVKKRDVQQAEDA